MFYHKNLAVDGLFPGIISKRSVSNLGTFETTIIIEPVKPASTGGGYVPVARGEKPDRYRVTIRVVINGKRFEDTYIVDDTKARVMAALHGVDTFTEDRVMVTVNGVQVFNESEIMVKVNFIGNN